MRFHCALAVAIAIGLPALAADWTGIWIGGTTALGSVAFVQMEITQDSPALRGALEVPSEDVTLPLRDIETKGDTIVFRLPSPYGEFHFSGVLQGDIVRGRLKTPMGTDATMHFRRTGASRSNGDAYAGTYRLPNGELLIVMARPHGQLRTIDTGTLASTRLAPLGGDRFLDAASVAQDPTAGKEVEFTRSGSGAVAASGGARRVDLFVQEPVTFKSGELEIAGTLLMPRSKGPHPAAVIVHGSGAVTRDALLQRAQLLLRMGIAVLLYDKRGTGESQGDWRSASFEELATDAVAALHYLKARPDIDRAKIGVVGHSQAGWIIPIIADRDPQIAFAVVASGGGVSPEEQELFRAETQTRNDFSAADADEAKRLTALQWSYARTGGGWAEYEKAWQASATKLWFPRIAGPRTSSDPLWAQVRSFAAYDPLPYLRKMRVPVLVIFGASDENVPAKRAAELWRANVGHADVVTVADTGHNLIVRQKEGAAYAPQYVHALKKWLQKRKIVQR